MVEGRKKTVFKLYTTVTLSMVLLLTPCFAFSQSCLDFYTKSKEVHWLTLHKGLNSNVQLNEFLDLAIKDLNAHESHYSQAIIQAKFPVNLILPELAIREMKLTLKSLDPLVSGKFVSFFLGSDRWTRQYILSLVTYPARLSLGLKDSARLSEILDMSPDVLQEDAYFKYHMVGQKGAQELGHIPDLEKVAARLIRRHDYDINRLSVERAAAILLNHPMPSRDIDSVLIRIQQTAESSLREPHFTVQELYSLAKIEQGMFRRMAEGLSEFKDFYPRYSVLLLNPAVKYLGPEKKAHTDFLLDLVKLHSDYHLNKFPFLKKELIHFFIKRPELLSEIAFLAPIEVSRLKKDLNL